MVSRDHGDELDPWNLDAELRYHIQHCPCSCNHMGYGNFLNYQIPQCPRQLPPYTAAPLPTTYINRNHYYYDFDYTTSIDSCSCSSTLTTSSNDSTSRALLKPYCGSWYLCLVVCIIVGTIAIGLSLPFALNSPTQPQTLDERLHAVHRLLKTAPLIDGHNDLPWNLRKFLHNKLAKLNLSAIAVEAPWSKSQWSHTDIPRLRKGHLGAQFWSAYVPCKAQHLDAVQVTLEQIDIVQRLVDLNSQHLQLVQSSSELVKVHKEGKIASLIGIEGGHALGNSLAVLRTFYSLGARYLTLTHSCDTSWAQGSNTRRQEEGLSDFGKSVIREMNRLGMIVDLSHTSMSTAKAAINSSQAPVIFSHSSAYSLCNSSRNVPDDVLKLVAHNGGIVMVNFYTFLVSCSENATMQDVIKHINHIRAIAGVNHVGIGAGYDGINMTPVGLEDVSRYPHLLAELLADPGWSEADVALLAGMNFLRVFQSVEKVRDEWKLAKVLPGEESDRLQPPMNCRSIYS